MKILLALTSKADEAEKGLASFFERQDIETQVKQVTSLIAIKNALDEEKYDALVTQYGLGAKPFTAEELGNLFETDERMKLVVIIPETLKGSEFLSQCLSAGVTCCVYSRESDPETLGRLAGEGRTRKEARLYYGLAEERARGRRAAVGVVDPGRIAQLRQYLALAETDDAMIGRANYVADNVSEEELAALFATLTDAAKEKLRAEERFAPFFADPVSRDADLKASMANMVNVIAERVSRPSPVIIKKELVDRKVIGVFGLYRGAGITTAAVSLAKTLSAYCGVSLAEVSDTPVIHDRYRLDANIGPDYESVPHKIAEEVYDINASRNIYEGIRFLVPNPQKGSVTTDAVALSRLISSVAEECMVIDFGMSITEAVRAGLPGCLTHILCVTEAVHADDYLSHIKEQTYELGKGGRPVGILAVQEHYYRPRKGGEQLPDSFTVTKNLTPGRIQGLEMPRTDEERLFTFLGIAKKPGRKKQAVKQAIQRTGLTTVGVIGTDRGCGTTHSAFLIASSLRKTARVAYVEANATDEMRRLGAEYGYTGESGYCYSLDGIDIYSHTDPYAFITGYGHKYDYIVLDLGSMHEGNRDEKKRELFAMCTLRFIVADASPWKLFRIGESEQALKKYDASCSAVMLLPMKSPKFARNFDLYRRTGKRKMACLPYVAVPSECDGKTAAEIRTLTGID